MRFAPFVIVAAVALVSCGGGSSSTPSVSTHANVPVSFPPQTGTWGASLGPWNSQTSGKLNAVAIDPHNANTIYVAGGIGATDGVTTDAGVYRSNDGGASWSAADGGLSDTTINDLAIDPSSGALLAATESGGIERSIDGAHTWTQASSATAVRQFAREGSAWYAAAHDGIYRSSDGVTWSVLTPTSAAANAIAVSNGDVYAGLVDGSIVRYRNGSLQALATLPALGAPPVVHAIAIDPNAPQSIYASVTGMVAGTYSDALFHSVDGGISWSQVAFPSALRGSQAIAFSTVVPHRLYVAGVGLAYTDDGVRFTSANGYGDARTIAVGAGDQLIIASDQGVARGTFGSAFVSLTAGLPVNIVRSVAVRGQTVLVTMQDFAPARSIDGGRTWQTLETGSNENGTAYINPNASNLCYVVDNGVAVSNDGCATFVTQAIGPHLESTQPIATDPQTAQTYVLSGNGAYVARDGVSFVPARWEVPSPVDVAVDPTNGSHLFASSDTGGVRVWHSTDGGRTFSPSATLVPPGPSYPQDVPAIAVDPRNADVVAVTDTAIYRSTDGGATFTALHETYSPQARARALRRQMRDPEAGPAGASAIGYNVNEHVAFVATPAGSLLLVSDSQGLFASLDDGSTIVPASSGAISHVFEGFAADGTQVCAGTDGQGVVCSDASALASAAQ